MDTNHAGYTIPDIDLNPAAIRMVLISEAAPESPANHYYAAGDPLFAQTTVQAFTDAGAQVKSIQDILARGIYLTTAVKCGKTGYGIQTGSIKECSFLLAKELALFPNLKAILLMGDVAIKALNAIATRAGEGKVIPTGSTYKIRGREYFFRGIRAFPSYLQAGPSFFIEKSKRRMIAEDIKSALALLD
jgi:uracil-DNA glycosylase